jgi:hypothetical protein
MSDPGLLEAALEGLQIQKQRIETQIEEVKGALGKRRTSSPVIPGALPTTETPKRQLSEAARKRIAAAQKKRWAEYRKATRHNGTRAVKREGAS